MGFKLAVNYRPRGDQENAIAELTRGVREGEQHQVLLGVTGSGKTFTMAKVIEAMGRPALVMAHNKTLAAQLYHEFRSFFPENAVEYFVSYYDYYQPEAYIPSSDVYMPASGRGVRECGRRLSRRWHAPPQVTMLAEPCGSTTNPAPRFPRPRVRTHPPENPRIPPNPSAAPASRCPSCESQFPSSPPPPDTAD